MKFSALLLVLACLGLAFAAPVRAQSVTIEYEYDALGRLKEVKDPTNGDRIYNYDAAGNRTNVTVVAGNQPPVAEIGEVYITDPSESFQWHALWLAADPDGDPLIFTSVSSGTIINGGATWSFTSPPNNGNQVTYTFTVSDGNGGTSTGNITLRVEV